MKKVIQMTYDEAVSYLEACRTLGSRPGLETIKALLKHMGHPEQKLKFIHIAGTNGKGSTGSFISSILASAGYKVGLFSSPAVYHLCEMIAINGEFISKSQFAEALGVVKKAADGMIHEGLFPPTEFEILTAVAYFYFTQISCDFAIMECGMGGRLDATNVMEETMVSVLSRIDYDHMNFLGDTLTAITREKCGILRAGRPVVSYPLQEKDVLDEIKRMTDEHKCSFSMPLFDAITIHSCDENGSSFSYDSYNNLRVSLLGKHQIFNAVTALETINSLKGNGIQVSQQAIYEGLLNAKWNGRFQLFSNQPPIILDGAHNVNGVRALTESIETVFSEHSFIGVVGMLCDKNYAESLAQISKVCNLLIFTKVKNPRSATTDALAETAKKLNIPFFIEEEPDVAVKKAVTLSDGKLGVLCAGSLYNLAIYQKSLESLGIEKEL